MKKIVFENVTVLFENKKRSLVTALEKINLKFHPHKINVLVGESGSGKSTLLRCLTGELVYEGKILIDDKDIESIPTKDRSMSFMTQDFIIFPKFTVYENILFPLKVAKLPYEEADYKVKEIARKLDLEYLLTRKPKYISIGQASRAALAKALVKDSSVYLFDEPTKNLDSENSFKITHLIKDYLKERNKTCIYVTHDMKEALFLADYIYVLSEGHFVGEFTPEEFLNSKLEIIKNLRLGIENEKQE